MERRHVTFVAGIVTLIVAIFSFTSTISPTSVSTTGAAVSTIAGGSLIVTVITLVIALSLFAKYFGLLK